RMPLFDDVSLEALVERQEWHSETSASWFGHIAGIALSDFLIVRVEETVYAQFRDYAHDRYLEIRYTPSGVYAARELGADAGDFCGKTEAQAVPMDEEAVPEGHLPPQGPSERGGLITVDVLGVYTPQARAAEGSAAAMQALFLACVDDMNVRLSNSLTHTRVRLVWVAEMTGYIENGCD